jgi:hypothetical protein
MVFQSRRDVLFTMNGRNVAEGALVMATTICVQQYEQAEREVTREENRRGFRLRAAVYALVNTVLIAINLYLITETEANFVWFALPLVGWGAGLAMYSSFGVRRLETNVTHWQRRVEEWARLT